MAFCGNSSSKEKQKDSPLKLKSTADWKQRGKKQQPSHLPSLSPYHPQEFATSKLNLHDTSYRVNNFVFFPFFLYCIFHLLNFLVICICNKKKQNYQYFIFKKKLNKEKVLNKKGTGFAKKIKKKKNVIQFGQKTIFLCFFRHKAVGYHC